MVSGKPEFRCKTLYLVIPIAAYIGGDGTHYFVGKLPLPLSGKWFEKALKAA